MFDDVLLCCFFFFKQKTAYEMRISDWSSDVCSSDLVGGYLGTNAHSAGEWMAQGGIVSFTGNDVVTQAGSQINISGGTLDVQDGFINQSWLRGADGRLYEISRAPGDLMYTGLYNGFESTSERWGNTRTFYNPLIAPRQRFESGYTVGRDAGRLIISTTNAVLEGELVGDTYQGDRQTQAAQAGLDGYYQAQDRKSVVSGKSVSVRVDLGGRRIIKKKKTHKQKKK